MNAEDLTLGAIRPRRGAISIPGRETLYWLPCLTRAEGSGEPHATFITSSIAPRIRCPACRPGGTPAIAPPADPPPVIEFVGPSLPWGAGPPAWELDGAPLGLEEVWRERAAVLEYEAGHPRAVAELLAYREITRRHPAV